MGYFRTFLLCLVAHAAATVGESALGGLVSHILEVPLPRPLYYLFVAAAQGATAAGLRLDRQGLRRRMSIHFLAVQIRPMIHAAFLGAGVLLRPSMIVTSLALGLWCVAVGELMYRRRRSAEDERL